MNRKAFTRRAFLHWGAAAAAAGAGAVLAGCKPTEVIKEVTRVVKETVEVEKTVEVEVEVEKEVTKVVTQVVEKEKVVTPTPAPVKPVELRYMTLNSPLILEWAGMVADKLKEREGHTVTIENAPWPIKSTFIPALAAGTPPDMVGDLGKMHSTLYPKGTWMEVSSVLELGPIYREDIFEAELTRVSWFGKLFGIPYTHNFGNQRIVFYRKDLFDEAGLPYPAREKGFNSYEEVYELARQLTKRDAGGAVSRWGWAPMPSWDCGRVVAGMYDQDVPPFDADKNAFNLASPEAVSALKTIILDPLFVHGVSPTADNQGPVADRDYNEAFQEGLYALTTYVSTLWVAHTQENEDLVEQIDWAELPGMKPGVHTAMGEGGFANLILADIPAEKRSAAMAFCQGYLEFDLQFAVAKSGNGPAVTGTVDNPEFKKQVETNKMLQKTASDLKMDVENPTYALGYEWGITDTANYPTTRCWFDAEGFLPPLENCVEWNTGQITAEQLCAEWQEAATLVRREFYKSVGITV